MNQYQHEQKEKCKNAQPESRTFVSLCILLTPCELCETPRAPWLARRGGCLAPHATNLH